ncbi:polysaccharide biosynthesis C-terminal domain-containing protein [Clostridium sp. WLY-B-L2]|uniref:Polysaccharide biosynthesis C-terminal domain-containing protein n=1 Tax=Clostridium aromativorans TaxID=2836848 RepID=A0ABS8N974_9CLOT|nr:oligosaccharide flippase family protein [Clostridium aromativorans]MCC9296350.1 polysaccharide biosynthesis C-terminal domain-containing protein [Clostridium aromativorans]
MPEKKSFIKVGIIYAIGQVLSKAISFILLPIYTRQLGTVGYGQLSLADTVLDFINTFVILSIYSGYIRFYREYKGEERNKLRNTAINFALILTIIDLIILMIFGRTIANIIFSFNNSYKIFALIIIRSLLSQFVILLMCDYNLNYEAVITVTINLVMLIMNLILSIYFVVYKKQGIIGVYSGYILSILMVLIYLVMVNVRNFKFEIDKKMLKYMLTFSGGLLPCNVSGTILTLADRYFLAGYRNYSEIGIYSVGYKFGMLIQPLFVDPFKSIFTPYKFQIWKDDDASVKFNDMYKKYHFFGCLIIIFIALYSRIIISIFTTKDYMDAYKIIMLILFSYFLYGENEFYSLGIQIKNKTYLTGIIMLLGGMINIILNVILIPKFGMYGAAVATLISYLSINIINSTFSVPLYKVKYDFTTTLINYLIVIGIYGGYYLLTLINKNLIIEFFYNILFIFIYIYLCLKFKLVKKDDLVRYIKLVKMKILSIKSRTM